MCALDLNLAYQFTKIKADIQIKLTLKYQNKQFKFNFY